MKRLFSISVLLFVSVFLMGLMVSCNKNNETMPVPELDLTGKTYVYKPTGSIIYYRISFYDQGKGHAVVGGNAVFEEYDLEWTTEKYQEGNYYLYIKKLNNSDTVTSKNRAFYDGNDYRLNISSKECTLQK